VNIRLVHDTGTGGEHEYILVGIRCWEDIDLIKTLLGAWVTSPISGRV
jgi:hypothetical protein